MTYNFAGFTAHNSLLSMVLQPAKVQIFTNSMIDRKIYSTKSYNEKILKLQLYNEPIV